MGHIEAALEHVSQSVDNVLRDERGRWLLSRERSEAVSELAVSCLLPDGTTEDREIRTGLSDAIHVDVIEGLEEGEKVVEPPPREIS